MKSIRKGCLLILIALAIIITGFYSVTININGHDTTEETNNSVRAGVNEELMESIPVADDISISENAVFEVNSAPKIIHYKKGYIKQQIVIKEKANTKSKTLKTVFVNKKIKYRKYNKKWARVKCGKIKGFIQRKYISKKKLTKKDIYKRLFGYVPSDFELNEMLLVAMSESGNTEPIIGIERVIEAMINRVHLKKFTPTTLYGVLHQGQHFARVKDGSIYRFTINNRTRKAWNNILKRGYVIDNKVCFWAANDYLSCCEPAYIIGHHYFGY